MDIVIGIVIATAKRTCSSNVNIMWICQAEGGSAKANRFRLVVTLMLFTHVQSKAPHNAQYVTAANIKWPRMFQKSKC